MAAAAAIAGDTKWVLPPLPWRPSTFRLEVDAQRSPGSRRSGFMAKHILQPASRQSNPASRKTRSKPSDSACRLTCPLPGTTMALTALLTRCPFTTFAAARRSSIRALVHEPMNTRWIETSVKGTPALSPMYSKALAVDFRSVSSAKSSGRGTDWLTEMTCPGFVPQEICGSISRP